MLAEKPKNLRIIFLRPNTTGVIQPADLRLNAVIKQIYRKFYSRKLLSQLWDNSSRTGVSIKECVQKVARIIQHEITDGVFRASFRLTNLKKFEFLQSTELPTEAEEELEAIRQEEIEEFDPYEPLRAPFECESCSFFTTDSIMAAEHIAFHEEIAKKVISRWEPSISPKAISVIVPNPNFSLGHS